MWPIQTVDYWRTVPSVLDGMYFATNHPISMFVFAVYRPGDVLHYKRTGEKWTVIIRWSPSFYETPPHQSMLAKALTAGVRGIRRVSRETAILYEWAKARRPVVTVPLSNLNFELRPRDWAAFIELWVHALAREGSLVWCESHYALASLHLAPPARSAWETMDEDQRRVEAQCLKSEAQIAAKYTLRTHDEIGESAFEFDEIDPDAVIEEIPRPAPVTNPIPIPVFDPLPFASPFESFLGATKRFEFPPMFDPLFGATVRRQVTAADYVRSRPSAQARHGFADEGGERTSWRRKARGQS